ncbi:hypothetical protein GCM10022206_20020 [Streptomyces chiangmaiensis]
MQRDVLAPFGVTGLFGGEPAFLVLESIRASSSRDSSASSGAVSRARYSESKEALFHSGLQWARSSMWRWYSSLRCS